MININKSSIPKITLLLFLITLIFLYFQSYGPYGKEIPGDLLNYLWAGSQIAGGESPYEIGTDTPFARCPYPLFLGFILYPFHFIPNQLLGIFWYSLNLFSFFAASYFVLKLSSGVSISKDIYQNSWLIFLVFLLLFSPIQNNFKNAQINAVILFLGILSLYFYSSKKPVMSSLCLSAAIAIKLLPLILIFFYLARKEWKLIIVTFIFSILFLFLPIITLGENIFLFYSQYIHDFILNSSMSVHTQGNFLIQSNLFSLFQSILSLDNSVWIRMAMNIFLLMVIVWYDISQSSNHTIKNNVFSFQYYLILMILVSPISEKHHLVLLFPSILLLSYQYKVTPNVFSISNKILLVTYFLLFLLAKLLNEIPLYAITNLILLYLLIRVSQMISKQETTIKNMQNN